ncbi:aspartate--tRNA ligase [Buchnera aphidicola (Ceratovacuna keduensis)]|uniref:aspartate--tRNA ligase n=1 Tax=Buchnera aphidicola TaxID=9 RepID=UPI0031B8ADBF
MRTEYCRNISTKFLLKKVCLCGWIEKIKNFGHFLFFYIKDITGLTQIIVKKENIKKFKKIKKLKNGFCVQISGTINKRSKKNINKNIINGDVEVHAKKINILSKSKNIPIDLLKKNKEKNRLKYRYLDLRNENMQKNLIIRSKIIYLIHKFMQKNNFIHIETPIITKSTPEGARDYIIPSRKHIGKFYALPQSPQIFKQLLMISGFDKYYQIAKCFRDEDTRSNRQPEFTQIDIEASFIDEKKIKKISENLINKIFKKFCKIKFKNIKTITYKKSIKKYGTDSPDIRNPLKIIELTKLFKKNYILKKNNNKIIGIYISKKNNLSLKKIKYYKNIIKKYNINKVFFIKILKNINKINIYKNIEINKKIIKKIIKLYNVKENDIIIISITNKKNIYKIFGKIIKKISNDFNLIDKNAYKAIWIKEFPMFKKNKNGKFSTVHHPFTLPKTKSIKKIKKYPNKILSKSYDLIINGKEIGGGSVRINNLKMQKLIFKIINLSKKDQKKKFGFFLNALKYGPPPHSGIALGLDRIMMIITKNLDIKNIIAFPKTSKSSCIMTNAPNKIEKSFLKELYIKTKK